MCFPNRRQKADIEKRDHEKDTKGPNSPNTPPIQSPTIPPITNNSLNIDMSSPKVAIVIYSLYGHIAKRSLCVPPISSVDDTHLFFVISCRGRESWHRKSWWDSCYISVRIYLIFKMASSFSCSWLGLPKLFLKRSSPRCTLRRNPITRLLPQKRWPNMMLSSWASPLVMATSPLNGRYVVIDSSQNWSLVHNLLRPSGTRPANFGLGESSQENMRDFSFQLLG